MDKAIKPNLSKALSADQEQMFQALFESATEGIVVADTHGKIVMINPNGSRMFGYSKEELVGQKIEVLIPKPLAKKHVSHRKGYNKNPHPRSMGIGMDLSAVKKDGSEFPVEVSLSHAKIEEQTMAIAFVIDITERRRINERANLLGRVFDQSLNEIYIFDAQTYRFLQVNHGAQKNIGYTMAELATMTPVDIKPEFTKKLFDQIVEPLVSQKEEIIQFETVHQRKDGSNYTVEVHLQQFSFESRPVYMAIILDITARKEAEQEIKRANQELKRSNAELEQFAYVASHDLQEPLRMVSSYTQLLAKRYQDQLDAEANEFIGYAVDGAGRMQILIKDLLEYSRVGTRGNPFTATDIGEVLETVKLNLTNSIEEAGAKMKVNKMPVLNGDGSQLVQLFQNLISNALKFKNGKPPQISISARELKDQWKFTVKDNGIGIDPKYQDRIFMIFQRLHTKEDYVGSGIGLAICKKIVERHGGRIWYESIPGGGTIFYFTLRK